MGVRAHQAHGEVVVGPAWTLQGGRTWVPCQGAAPVSSLLVDPSAELFVRGMFPLTSRGAYRAPIGTLTSFYLSGQWSKATGEDAAHLAFLLI